MENSIGKYAFQIKNSISGQALLTHWIQKVEEKGRKGKD